MATNYKNTVYSRSTGHDTFPASKAKTGTITTTNAYDGKRVIGTSTLFTTELEIGGWIVDIAHDEIRKITNILTDTNLTIDHAFSNSLTGLALKYVPPSDSVELSVVFSGASGKIDGQLLPANIGFSFGKTGRDNSAVRDFIDPLIIDATGTVACLGLTK